MLYRRSLNNRGMNATEILEMILGKRFDDKRQTGSTKIFCFLLNERSFNIHIKTMLN